MSGGLTENDEPSAKMKVRLDIACQVYWAGNFNGIITTSKGTFRDGNGHSVTEAEAASRYLTERLINPSKIFKEERSMDTMGNAFFSRIMFLEHRGWWEPTVITNEFHMPRARFIFDRVMDAKYRLQYVTASNAGIRSEELEKWQRHEEEMLKFYERLLTGDNKGDLEFFEDYIYHRNPA